jgi:hypothetical protein
LFVGITFPLGKKYTEKELCAGGVAQWWIPVTGVRNKDGSANKTKKKNP